MERVAQLRALWPTLAKDVPQHPKPLESSASNALN
jgi:hypothetical protein